MKQQQFQYESEGVAVSLHTPEPHLSFSRLESYQAGLESAILGLRLRGWLTNSEKDLLDCLAPTNHLCFLMKGEEYIHPAGCQLFEKGTFESPPTAQSGAFFQQHYESSNPEPDGHHTVYSAQINPYGSEAVTMGILGPEDSFSGILIKDRFGRMIEMARQAWKLSEPVMDKLEKIIEDDDPLLLINRCSGRIIHLNDAARTLVDPTGEKVVGQEYSIIKSVLADQVSHYRLRATNLVIEDFFLATLQLSELNHEECLPKSKLFDQLLEKIRDKVSSVTTISSYLKAMPTGASEYEPQQLSGNILNESSDIENLVFTLKSLLTHENAKPTTTLLGEDLALAINRVASEQRPKPEIIQDVTLSEISLRYPISGVSTLLMAAMLGLDERGLTASSVEVTSTPLKSIVSITSKPWIKEPGSPEVWADCAIHLSSGMNIKYQTLLETESKTMTSTLEFDNA